MKKLLLFATAVAFYATSCQTNEVKSVTGTIIDATMNTIMIAEIPSGDTVVFSTMDAEKITGEQGILIDDTAQIFYQGELKIGMHNVDNTATKLIVTSANSPLYGSWVEPIPGMDGVQGITLARGGDASSVNMHTLLYKSWKQNGNTLTLVGDSEGNGQTIEFTQVATIEKLDADSLVFVADSITFRYAKQK